VRLGRGGGGWVGAEGDGRLEGGWGGVAAGRIAFMVGEGWWGGQGLAGLRLG